MQEGNMKIDRTKYLPHLVKIHQEHILYFRDQESVLIHGEQQLRRPVRMIHLQYLFGSSQLAARLRISSFYFLGMTKQVIMLPLVYT